MHVEFTNACNLKCVYCNNPHFPHPRGMMEDRTFDRLIEGLRGSRVDRVCMGGGEATTHPKFGEYARRLKKEVRVLTIVTNGHWTKPSVPEALLMAPVDFIEISVEAGTRQDFEAMRQGSDYDLVIRNLRELKSMRNRLRSPSHINLRMMVRPSQRGVVERESRKFWKRFGDTLMPQYVLKTEGITTIDDAYTPKAMALNEFPKCSLPFRNIQIRSNGDIPICQISGSSLSPSKKVITGNINDASVQEIWNGVLFKQYRNAHRARNEELMPICKGCKGC
jgi:MoaA/NifB/PqqE/SkfB family radical SAM enzyme